MSYQLQYAQLYRDDACNIQHHRRCCLSFHCTSVALSVVHTTTELGQSTLIMCAVRNQILSVGPGRTHNDYRLIGCVQLYMWLASLYWSHADAYSRDAVEQAIWYKYYCCRRSGAPIRRLSADMLFTHGHTRSAYYPKLLI